MAGTVIVAGPQEICLLRFAIAKIGRMIDHVFLVKLMILRHAQTVGACSKVCMHPAWCPA